jgi:hypothetical protein
VFAPLSLHEFYAETLKQANFEPPKEELEKVAAARNIPLETLKIARSIFEQLQLDGVPYESSSAMLEDSIKIATAYVNHVQDAKASADKLAGDLHRVARHAVEGYLSAQGIELDADEGVKIAGLQAQSFQKLARKEAAQRQLDSEASKKPEMTTGKCAEAADKTATTQYTPVVHPDTVDVPKSIESHALKRKMMPMALENMIESSVGSDKANVYLHHLGEVEKTHPYLPFEQQHAEAVNRVYPNGKPSPRILGMHPGVALGAGGLGLGALYLLHRNRAKQEEERGRMQRLQDQTQSQPQDSQLQTEGAY